MRASGYCSSSPSICSTASGPLLGGGAPHRR
ncbi:Uncharacterised protein [Bordetella pertussis]|nr:Uncharacterised protein [Bordetella pertussis]